MCDYILSLSSMQCAKARPSFVACLVIRYFCTLYHKERDFLKRAFENELCVLNFHINLSKKFVILRKTE